MYQHYTQILIFIKTTIKILGIAYIKIDNLNGDKIFFYNRNIYTIKMDILTIMDNISIKCYAINILLFYSIRGLDMFKKLKIGSIFLKLFISMLVIIIGYNFLTNNKFFNDAYTIYDIYLNIPQNEVFNFSRFDGFSNVAHIYLLLSFGKALSFNGIFCISSIIYFITIVLLGKTIVIKYHKTGFVLFCIFFVFDTIFLMQPSKDQFSLLISVLVLSFIKSKNKFKNIYIIIIMLIYSFLFRSYYLLILFFYFFFIFFSKRKRETQILIICFFFIILDIVFYKTTLLEQAINYRYYSEKFLGGFTNTLIQNLIPYGPGELNIYKYLGNFFINLIRILFPIEVLWKSPSRGVFFVTIQLFLTYLLYNRFKFIKVDKTIRNVFIYIITFILVQAIFEPDFGSVFRHSMSILPFYLYMIFSINIKELKEKIDALPIKRKRKIKIVWRRSSI